MTAALSLVVGAGGLLGSSVAAALERRGPVWRPATRLPWGTPAAEEALRVLAGGFAAAADGDDWQVAWCAGAGVQGSTAVSLAGEERALEAFLDALAAALPARARRCGTVFLASSVGGVYGGAADPPFTERTPPRPVSAYGQLKLRLEDRTGDWGAEHGVPVVVGRIANLYGPGQDLAKPQGLISQLCRAQVLRQPLAVYVPLDTVRDYLYADDCGERVADLLARARAETAAHGPATEVKIVASEQGVTVGAVLGELRRILKRRPQVVHAVSPAARFQARDLRVRSVVWGDLPPRPVTPLPVGMRQVLGALVARQQRGLL